LKPLAATYPEARVIGMDFAGEMLGRARRQRHKWRRFDCVAGRAEALPFGPESLDLVFSNLALQWCVDPAKVFADVHDVLKGRSLFLFTTLGPDTLRELRAAWAEVDDGVHVHEFVDMHNI